LRRKGIVEQTGIRGRGVHYVLAGMGTRRGQWGHGPAGSGNGDTMGTMGTSGARNSDDDELAKGAIKGPKGPPAARGRRTGTRAKGGRR
jgi:hypothetical protein